MSKPKSLAESLFEDLVNEEKPIDLKDHSNVTTPQQKSLSKKSSTKKSSEINIKSYVVTTPTPETVAIDPLSNFVLQNDKLLIKLKKCRVRLPKIGQKKLLQMIKKKTIKKKNNKKNKLKLEKNINLNKSINNINDETVTPKKTVVRLSRVDIDNINDKTISPTRKRKSSDSPLQIKNSKKKDSPTAQSSQQSKLFFKLDTTLKPNRRKSIASSSSPTLQQLPSKSTTKGQQKKYTANDKSFTIPHLQDTFGRQFFKCRVRVNKIHSLDNLNVQDFEMELERKEKKKIKKNKLKGLNKSVSFVETVEVFGESDSEDNNTTNQELNKDIIELDALLDEPKIDGIAGGDDGGNLIIDNDTTTLAKKEQPLINNDENTMNKNDIIAENIFTVGDELLIVSTPKDKSTLTPPGKIGRIRKSFSPLKSEESPRNKLFKKGDEKIVKNFDLTVDDDEDNDADDDGEDNDGDDDDDKNDDEEVKIISEKSADTVEENKKLENDTETDNNDSIKSTTENEKNNEVKNITITSDQYESLSSDDSKDFAEAKDSDAEEIAFKTKTNIDENNDEKNDDNNLKEIQNICNDDEDDDYYLPKPKTIQINDEIKDNEKQQHESSDDVEEETIEKIISSVNEDTISNNKNQLIENDNYCNGSDLDGNEILQKVVDTFDMLNSNIIPSDSQFGEELKLSEDEEVGNVIENVLPTITTTETIPTLTTTETIPTLTTTETIPTLRSPTVSPSPLTKFSFNSFLKSSIQTIKTKIMPDSPKRTTSADDIITTTVTTAQPQSIESITTTQQQSTESTTTKTIRYLIQHSNDDDDDDDNGLIPTQDILLDEIDDESSALLGDPVLGGREMSF